MSMSDVTTGTNSYYILQLLQLPAKGAYALFCKWGRTGTHIGSSKLTEYKRLEKATEAFECVLFFALFGVAFAVLCVRVDGGCVCVCVWVQHTILRASVFRCVCVGSFGCLTCSFALQ